MSAVPYRTNTALMEYSRCGKCAGTGDRIQNPYPGGGGQPCSDCNATGEIFEKYIYLPSGLFYSHEVLECIDATEYGELTDAQKEGVQLILMCGLVDLNEGKAGRVRLLNWFGAESTTVTNLTALLDA